MQIKAKIYVCLLTANKFFVVVVVVCLFVVCFVGVVV